MQTARPRSRGQKRSHNKSKHKSSLRETNITTKSSFSTTPSTAPSTDTSSSSLSINTPPAKKLFKPKTQSLKSTAQYDSLQKRNPFIKHSESLPDVPISSFPEDLQYPSYRQHIRQCTDTIITVRQNNVEPYSYSHQIHAMHAIDPMNYGESAKQLLRPTRLVLDGPEGIEALSYYDQALSMPNDLDPTVSELKSYSKFLLTKDQDVQTTYNDKSNPLIGKSHISTNTGLKSLQKAALPTSLHTNSLVIPTGHSQTASDSSTSSSNCELTDIQLTNLRYNKHLEYAETSTAIKNIGYWGPESGSTDSIVGQHYALPGMLVATTSQRALGYVAAMGGISTKVSSVEAAGLLAGQPMYHFQAQNPVLVNLHGFLSQWTSPQDVIAVLVQYLGELAFPTSLGLQQTVCVELTDKGNQFSIDQLATICSTIGSLPNVSSITVPPNATQLQYLRDTNRGVFNKFVFEYGPQLLEPDHRVKYTETVDIDLSKLTPCVSVHSSTANLALNTVSCPLNYLDAMTGENPSKQLNLSKLTHIDNIAYHPAVHVDSFHHGQTTEYHITNPKTGQRHRVLPNRYQYLPAHSSEDKLESVLGKYKKSKIGQSIDKMTKKLIDPNAPQPTEAELTKQNEQQKQQQQQKQQDREFLNANAKRLTLDDVQISPEVSTVGLTSAIFPSQQYIPTTSSPQTSQSTTVTTLSTTSQSTPSSSKSLFARAPSSSSTSPSSTSAPQKSHPHNKQQTQSQQTFWPEKPNIILIRGGYNELKQSLKIWLQCLAEGMKPKVETFIQPDTPQTLMLLKQASDLCDEHGVSVFHLIQEFSQSDSARPGIRLLTPGTGSIDYLLSDFIIKNEQAGIIPSRTVHPTILSTDLGLAQYDAGLNHYTPHLFTSSNEHSALVTFTGNLSYDPINHTLSPKQCKFYPEDHNSFYLFPSHGAEPQIDQDTGKLRIPDYIANSKYQLESLVTPRHTIPSNVMQTEFHLSRRIDLQFQIYNTRYKEGHQINTLSSVDELEVELNKSVENDFSQALADQHESINSYLCSPTSFGYQSPVTRLSKPHLISQSTSQLVENIIQPHSQSIIHTYPSTWWNNNNIVDLPVLCNLNSLTSAADIAGLDQQLRFSPQQQQFLTQAGAESVHLSNWLRAKFTPPSTSLSQELTPPPNPTDDTQFNVLSDVILRRFQATPRHLKYLFPFSNTQLQLRYALSGIKSLAPGALNALTKPEFISTTQPPSDGATSNASVLSPTNSLGFGLGMKLNQLITHAQTQGWTSFISHEDSQPTSSETSFTQQLRGVDHLSNETNLLWATHSTKSKSAIPNDFLNHMMPSVRTYLKLPTGRTFHEKESSSASQLLLPHSQSLNGNMHFVQTLAWNYFVNGTKWAIVADGLRPQDQQKISNSTRSLDLQLDNAHRWDQNGFGFGSPDDCDQAVRSLRLLGCAAILSSKINANFLRALHAHGVPAFHLSKPSDVNSINITDSITIMTHSTENETKLADNTPEQLPQSQSPTEQVQSLTPTKRRELFLPHQSPIVVHHRDGNRPTMKSESNIIDTTSSYDSHSLLWFRAGSVANAGVEQQLRSQLVDKALQYNNSSTQQQL